MSRFDYVRYDRQADRDQIIFKLMVQEMEVEIDRIECVRSRNLALTKLEEVYMWIGKGIRNDQIARNKTSDLNEERG